MLNRKLAALLLAAASCWPLTGCGGGTQRQIVPRTPTADEIEQADRSARQAETDELETYPAPKKPSPPAGGS